MNYSKELRKKDDSFTFTKKLQNTILHNAVLEQLTSIVRYLLEETDYCKDESHPNIINAINNNGESPFYYGAYNASQEQMKLLLKHGADTNVVTKNDSTPVRFLAQNGNKKLIEMLVENGFDSEKYIISIIHKPDEKPNKNIPNKYNKTILLILYNSGFLTCLKYIVKICKEKNIDLNYIVEVVYVQIYYGKDVKVDIIQL